MNHRASIEASLTCLNPFNPVKSSDDDAELLDKQSYSWMSSRTIIS
jgi:hypothetical protein